MSIKKHIRLIESVYNEIYIDNDYGEIAGYITSTDSEQLDNWMKNRHKIFNDEFIQRVRNEYDTIAFLNNMNVDDNYQGQGYGKQLLEDFIDQAYEEGAETIILYADLQESQREGFDLVKFYEEYGFEVLEKYEDGVLMMDMG